jgi:hypothetical protein
MTLYAKWITPSLVRVTFHSGEGSFVPPQFLPIGAVAAKPKNPSPPEVSEAFDGWYPSIPGFEPDQPWYFDTPVLEDLDLDAHWRCAGGYHLEGDVCVRDVCGPGEVYLEGVGCIPACPQVKVATDVPVTRRTRARVPRGMPSFTMKRFSAQDALVGVVGGIALEETALSHLLNAEGEKLQHFLFSDVPRTRRVAPTTDAQRLFDISKSAGSLVRSSEWLERIFSGKLFLSLAGLPAKLSTIRVRKLDDQGDPVEGAVFTFVGEGVVAQVVSDADGWLVCQCLPPGIYNVEEVSAPEGYIKDEAKHVLTLAMDGTLRLDGRIDGWLVNGRMV